MCEWSWGSPEIILSPNIDFLDVLCLRETRPLETLCISVLSSVFVSVIF